MGSWTQAYEKIISLLYASDLQTGDLELAIALAEISAVRRKDFVTEEVYQDFHDAMYAAISARKAGRMPPESLKGKFRSLYFDE